MARTPRQRTTYARIGVEELEPRTLLSVMTPAQVRRAYGFDQVTYSVNGRTIQADGTGQTIAIVTAYDHPRVHADLDTFTRQFNLYNQYGPASRYLTKVTPLGQAATDPTGLWPLETALDVQWAHAIAPGAKILLVQARTNNFNELIAAVDYARKAPGVVTVSMSWGVSEFASQTYWNSYFTTPAGHLGGSNGIGGPLLRGGVTFVAASGDYGAPPVWPSIAPTVLAVGGTTLTTDASGTYRTEVGWAGSGGG